MTVWNSFMQTRCAVFYRFTVVAVKTLRSGACTMTGVALTCMCLLRSQ